MKTNRINPEIKSKLSQIAAGVWRVISKPNLYVVRNEVGCDNGESIYQVFTRHTDPYNPANTVSEYNTLAEAAKAV